MKVAVVVKEEISDVESEYSSDLSTNSNSVNLGTTSAIHQNGDAPATTAEMKEFYPSVLVTLVTNIVALVHSDPHARMFIDLCGF
ncbi:UNVERIFIED_CONTAM: hypothetical protein PYX00_007573 [Menopon gallinae]|uniref:Uncharacterized protein n=1 Tax=Menopon gallinae TaxID=328185 RepID=A0AAW2HJP6_9NEOP